MFIYYMPFELFRYDKLVVPHLVDLILHLKGPAILVEPDNVERRSLGSLQFFQDRHLFEGLFGRFSSDFNGFSFKIQRNLMDFNRFSMDFGAISGRRWL